MSSKRAGDSKCSNVWRNIARERAIVPHDLPSVLGRIQFADGQLTGRAGRLAMADIREIGLAAKERVHLDVDSLNAFGFLKGRFMDNKPKTMSLRSEDNPVLVYTDGSYEQSLEGEQAMIGGVLISAGMRCRAFGNHVPKELLKRWHDLGKEHLIGQVEMYAVVYSEVCLAELLARQKGHIVFGQLGRLGLLYSRNIEREKLEGIIAQHRRDRFDAPLLHLGDEGAF